MENSKVLPPIDLIPHQQREVATLALGCFWSVDARFGIKDGVISTLSGYTGGTTENPSYHVIGDHIESVRVMFDPMVITFSDLMDTYWKVNLCIKRAWKRQYTAAVFFHNQEQEKIANNYKTIIENSTGSRMDTEIIPASFFYKAEFRHQKYHLQQVPGLIEEFRRIYPEENDLVASSSAARVNGFAAGYGSFSELELAMPSLGLSPDVQEKLEETVRIKEKIQDGEIRKCA